MEERQAAAARLAAAGVSRDLAPIGTTVAGKVGRSSGALGANALRPPSSTGQPPVPAPAADARPPEPLALPPPEASFPPMAPSDVTAIIAPPMNVQPPGAPSTLPAEAAAFAQSIAPRAAQPPATQDAPDRTPLYIVGGIVAAAALFYYVMRKKP